MKNYRVISATLYLCLIYLFEIAEDGGNLYVTYIGVLTPVDRTIPIASRPSVNCRSVLCLEQFSGRDSRWALRSILSSTYYERRSST